MGGMIGHESDLSISENYWRFAHLEAAGRSPAYQELAEFVAENTTILQFLGRLAPAKRQPNLLFAAARYILGEPANPDSLTKLIDERGVDLAAIMYERRTQTNEAARCAILVPALALIPGPLALIEVGAAAGLTLLVDFYNYDYHGHVLNGLDADAPVLTCQPIGSVPIPGRVPEVGWRVGLDLNPLDPSNQADVEWLSCLIWPGEEGRAERLNAATATARRHPAQICRGDLLDDLAGLAAKVPAGLTLVIYHTAVLAYVDEAKRRAFAALTRSLG
ncbi:MAG: DUF2332 domain-containing protein, partial [Acidimicrobiaceae bacterium]|nr:DUF2332 domain-containing protein [Acidimicrobiaceae bacterium]